MKTLTRWFLLICLLFLPLVAQAQAFENSSVQMNISETVSDGNALRISYSLVKTASEEPLYHVLEKVFVNGYEVPVVKSTKRTFGWLDQMQEATLTLDIADVPKAESYTIAINISLLLPRGEVIVMEALTDDNFLSYQEKALNYNNQGYVVSSLEGDIILAKGTYEEGISLTDSMQQAGKMTLTASLQEVLTVKPLIATITPDLIETDMVTWTIVTQAEISPLSLVITCQEIFPNSFSLTEAEALTRRFTVTDMAGDKSFYEGNTQELGEVILQADGSYRATFIWRSHSLVTVPNKIRLTPYTYNASMSAVEDPEHSIEIAFE